tara:strand:- start:4402 stop:5151 length:750 start_codon:yes stop_codon:yes gene_type:complete
MADILLVDSNPEHVRAFEGLVKYRTGHEIEVVPDCVQAIRRVHTRRPDLILINVLLFSSKDFGFAKALSEVPEHADIPLSACLSGHIGELTYKRIEALGAGLLELPVSAGEIDEALNRPRKVTGVETVSWGAAAKPEPTATQKPPPQSQAGKEKAIRSVNWAMDGPPSSQDSSARTSTQRSKPKRASNRKVISDAPVSSSTKDAAPTSFAPLTNSAERVESQAEFAPNARWEEVDPKNVKNRHRSSKRR